jgi:hypothetical protein
MNSIYDLIRLEITDHQASIRYPADFYPLNAIEESLKRAQRVLSWDLRDEGRMRILLIQAAHDAAEEAVREVFANVNRYPFYSRSVHDSFRTCSTPLISCIILLTANDLFVINHLVPSIIANSEGSDIEILIVYNGADSDLDLFRRFDVSVSEFGCVSKGYNQGVNRARGKYVAIFHDDCMLADAAWIPKCVSLLEQGYLAVTPELQQHHWLGPRKPLTVLKNLPLVTDRERLLALGGYDETYYVGYEDLDLTYKILFSGSSFSRVDLGYRHFNGMSTTLMFGGNRRLHKQLFALDLLPTEALIRLRDSCLQKLLENETSAWIQRNQFSYFLSKFERHWATNGYAAPPEMKEKLVGWPGPAGIPLITQRQSMIDFLRSVTGGVPEARQITTARADADRAVPVPPHAACPAAVIAPT